MLPRKNRLLKDMDFDLVKRNGRSFGGKFFNIKVLKKDDSPSRFGFVVSTKYSKRAVDRNRAKRLLREAVRNNMKSVNNGFDFVFFVKTLMLKAKKSEIEDEVKEIFSKVG